MLRTGSACTANDVLTRASLDALARDLELPTSTTLAAVQAAPPVARGTVTDLPLPDALRRELSASRVDEIVLVPIGPAGAEEGVLLLGWGSGQPGPARARSDAQTTEQDAQGATTESGPHAAAHRMDAGRDGGGRQPTPDDLLITAAAYLASLVANAEQTDELLRRDEAHRELDEQQALARRLDTLDELTRIGEGASTFEEFAARTVARVSAVLGAVGAQYGVFRPDGRFESAAMVGITDAFASLHRADSALRVDHAALIENGKPTIRGFDRALAGDLTKRAAEAAGYAAFAAIPVHVEGHLSAALMCVFDRQPDELGLDPAVLGSVARIAGIALTNFRRRERLEDALAAERRLVGLRQTLESLTIVGETATQFRDLAEVTVRQVVSVLGARFGAYAVIEPGQPMSYVGLIGVPPTFDIAWFERTARLRSFLETGPAYVQAMPAEAAPGDPRVAVTGDLTAYAALPVHDGGQVAAAIIVWFDRPAGALRIEQRELDAVSRIASISLANFRLRERLVASEARYRTLFEESPEPLLLATREGTITEANEASVRLFGDDEGWLVDRSLGEVIEWDPDRNDERLRRLSAMGRLAFRGLGRQSGGGRFPYEVVVHGVDVSGEPRLLLLIRDLTDEQRLQQELVQAQKMEAIGMLVSGVAHELNNPLAAIRLFSQLLRRDPRLPEDLRSDADLFEREVDRTKRIVQNLLDFARQRPPERHATRLDVLVGNVLDLQSYSLGAGGIAVDVDVPLSLPVVELDRGQMQQVLLNLLQNAIQSIGSSRASGRIRIAAQPRLRSDGEEVVWLSVADNGPGVPPELRERLFLPFFTTKEPGKGTGLGLSVSFGIVAAHDGHLWYESPPEGGARFVIELPLKAASEPAHREPADLVPGVAGVRRGEIDPARSVSAGPGVGYRANAQPDAAADAEAATPTTGAAAAGAAAGAAAWGRGGRGGDRGGGGGRGGDLGAAAAGAVTSGAAAAGAVTSGAAAAGAVTSGAAAAGAAAAGRRP